ncbi:MAG TPA: hypothetical protein DCR40_05235 [Prolixibacteraceae bacterium]|nr:hypothetical protein [Prolixibacteraceae bacterium]
MAETRVKGKDVGDRSITDVDIDLSAAPAKTPVVDADSVIIVDSANNLTKRTLFSTIVTYLANTFVRSTSYTAADVLTKIKTVDGTTSGLDADLLDGIHASEFSASYYSASQTAHGFSVGDCIKPSGSTWVKVIANSIANAGVSALVLSVTDANNFKYITSGLLPGAYTAGADYYSSTISAGALMTLSTPEVWTAGQVRQYIGTGVTGGLMIDLDAGDQITTSAFNDIYVTGMSFNNANRVLTLTRSASMSDLSIAIPFPEEEMGYEFRDITKAVAQTYVLDMKVSWPYTIKSIVCESDGTLTGVSVKINSTAVTGLSSLSVATKTETNATAANVTAAGDVVTINTATGYSGTPTIMRLKIKYQRI